MGQRQFCTVLNTRRELSWADTMTHVEVKPDVSGEECWGQERLHELSRNRRHWFIMWSVTLRCQTYIAFQMMSLWTFLRCAGGLFRADSVTHAFDETSVEFRWRPGHCGVRVPHAALPMQTHPHILRRAKVVDPSFPMLLALFLVALRSAVIESTAASHVTSHWSWHFIAIHTRDAYV